MMRLALLALLVASASCKRGTEPKAEVSEETRPGTERGSAGGFSASLSADLEVRKGSNDFFEDGSNAGLSGSAGAASSGAGSGASGSGSDASGAGTSGTSAGSAGAGSAGVGSSAGTSAGASGAGSGASAAAGSGVGGAGASGAGSAASASVTGSGGAGSASKVDTQIEIDPPQALSAMTPELKAIKLSLLPNWKRDVVEPATISLDVDVQSKDVKETFKFRYGYEDTKAPTDREAFKKYLADAKILKVTTDRQRGAAWYLEGDDGSGQTAFRLIVTWGGKRLYCGGSAYKSNELGDIRDEVVVQAKKICETVAL
ncbi:MAG: hypothetical protein ACKV2T_28190 [Kofleriaceae bacterium]